MNKFILGMSLCVIFVFCSGEIHAKTNKSKQTQAQVAAKNDEEKKESKSSVNNEKKAPVAKNVPTRITAENMNYAASDKQVVFNQNVHVSRPDFELWSNKLTAHLKPAKPKKEGEASDSGAPEGLEAGDIDKIVASGNVRMKREGRSGSCERATYSVDSGVLVMEGNPRLTDGENTITGETIKYYMNENRSEVIGGNKKRVEAIFSTSKKPNREGGER